MKIKNVRRCVICGDDKTPLTVRKYFTQKLKPGEYLALPGCKNRTCSTKCSREYHKHRNLEKYKRRVAAQI